MPLELYNFMKEQNINASRFFQDNLIKLKKETDEKNIREKELSQENDSLKKKTRAFIAFLESKEELAEAYSLWSQERLKEEKEKMPQVD